MTRAGIPRFSLSTRYFVLCTPHLGGAMHEQILAALSKPNYVPLKPKALARKIGVKDSAYAEFRKALRDLAKQGKVEHGRNHTVRAVAATGTVTGVFRRLSSGRGFVRTHAADGAAGPEIAIPEDASRDAATGDVVLVKITRKARHDDEQAAGEVLRVLERATRQFVGTYFERDGQGLVRVDGTVFSHSIYVGDPGAKGAKPDDKVVLDMVRFPSPEERGEGVITEVLGPRGKPGVDTLSIIREFDLPDRFPQDVP